MPSPLVAILPLTAISIGMGLPVNTVGVAAVGLLESLLTAQIVDDMTHTDSDKRRVWASCLRACQASFPGKRRIYSKPQYGIMRSSYHVDVFPLSF